MSWREEGGSDRIRQEPPEREVGRAPSGLAIDECRQIIGSVHIARWLTIDVDQAHSTRIALDDVARTAVAGELTQLRKDRRVKQHGVASLAAINGRDDESPRSVPFGDNRFNYVALNRGLIGQGNQYCLCARIERRYPRS